MDLGHNQITDEGVRYLSEELHNNIKRLDISDNDIQDSGTEYLSEALKINEVRFDMLFYIPI